MEERRVFTVTIEKLPDRYSVRIDGGEGVVLDEDYYQPRTSEEVGKLIELWLNGQNIVIESGIVALRVRTADTTY